jgi:hypothetical protein
MTKTKKVTVTLTRTYKMGGRIRTVEAIVEYRNGVVFSIYENNDCPLTGGAGWLTRANWSSAWDQARIDEYISSFPRKS